MRIVNAATTHDEMAIIDVQQRQRLCHRTPSDFAQTHCRQRLRSHRLVEPQASADSGTRRRIFVHRKSAEKYRLTEFAAEFCPVNIHQKYG